MKSIKRNATYDLKCFSFANDDNTFNLALSSMNLVIEMSTFTIQSNERIGNSNKYFFFFELIEIHLQVD